MNDTQKGSGVCARVARQCTLDAYVWLITRPLIPLLCSILYGVGDADSKFTHLFPERELNRQTCQKLNIIEERRGATFLTRGFTMFEWQSSDFTSDRHMMKTHIKLLEDRLKKTEFQFSIRN